METICMNKDVLLEILEKLPPESVLRFKSVSLGWRDLISSSTFLRRYAAADRDNTGGLVAFFQKAGAEDAEEPTTAKHCNILRIRNKLGNCITVPEHVGHFVNSSNGLILCSRLSCGAVVTYHVGNPFTEKFVELPPPSLGKGCLDVERWHKSTRPELLSSGLICEENSNDLVPVYMVLRAGMYGCGTGRDVERKIIHIDSYSSKTGEWSAVSTLQVSAGIDYLCHAPAVVANGVVHWYALGGIAVYDPNDGDRHVQLIKTPYYGKDGSFAFTRSAADDVLWLAVLVGKKLVRKKMLFYMLPKPKEGGYKRGDDIDSKEWVLVQEVSIFDISRMMKKGLVAFKEATLECLIPESGSDIVAVLRQEEKVFLYNVQRKSLAKFDYSGRYNKNLRLYPYFYSSSLSSYYVSRAQRPSHIPGSIGGRPGKKKSNNI